jgi:hypothetical protein
MSKIMLMGYGRHGKDTAADILRDHYELKIASSSYFVAEKAVYPTLKNIYSYADLEACYQDRHNHRKEWFDLINKYNRPDLSRMSREIFAENDVYVGLRNHEEYFAAKDAKAFDFSIWIDARERLKSIEDISSCTVSPHMADIIIDNNGSIQDLHYNIYQVMKK